jgi:hypothetical protein
MKRSRFGEEKIIAVLRVIATHGIWRRACGLCEITRRSFRREPKPNRIRDCVRGCEHWPEQDRRMADRMQSGTAAFESGSRHTGEVRGKESEELGDRA